MGEQRPVISVAHLVTAHTDSDDTIALVLCERFGILPLRPDLAQVPQPAHAGANTQVGLPDWLQSLRRVLRVLDPPRSATAEINGLLTATPPSAPTGPSSPLFRP